MKLLSICGVHHDLNVTVYDHGKIKYQKYERLTQVKHYSDKRLLDINKLVELSKKVDALVVDSIVIGLNKLENHINDKKLYQQFTDKIFIVDHHYLHALSGSLFNDFDVAVVIDGKSLEHTWSVFRDDTRIASGLHDESGSIGYGLVYMGHQANVTGHTLDIPGKVMGLQSYGNVDHEFMQTLQHYDITNVGAKIIRSEQSRIPIFGMYDMSKCNNTLNALRTLHTKTGEIINDTFAKYVNKNDVVVYSGGVAQNVIWNTQLKNTYKNLSILPHVGDEGLSLGGIEFLRRHFNLNRIQYSQFPYMQNDESTEEVTQDTIDEVADYLANGKIVAWYQDNGEIGPRALGNRSILMDPRLPNGKDIMNRVKNREYYRPFGASILREHAKEYFDLDFENPYMLYVGVSQKDNLKSITHVDGTCRVQTVEEGSFRLLLESFYKKTGCPVLLNTSLNVSGKPIAGHIKDAIFEFENTDIDVLVVGNTVYKKS